MSLSLPSTGTLRDSFRSLFLGTAFSPRGIAVTVLSVLTLLLGLGLLLVVRQLTGGITAELSYSAMLLTAIVTAVLAIASRYAWRHVYPVSFDGSSTARWLRISGDAVVGWGSSLALVLVAVGSAYPGDRTFDLFIWVPILMADQFLRQTFFDAGTPGQDFRSTALLEDQNCLDLTTAESPAEEDLVQQLYRVRDEAGVEVIYGTLRADFQAGQRHAVLHVAFCPPLAFLPHVHAAPFEGPGAKVKVAQALAHGARLEVRLDHATGEDCSVHIDLAALPE